MLNESEREHIRRACYLQKKSIRRIAQKEGYSRGTVERAIIYAPRPAYSLRRPRPAPRPRMLRVWASASVQTLWRDSPFEDLRRNTNVAI
jgi:hypothetical protein